MIRKVGSLLLSFAIFASSGCAGHGSAHNSFACDSWPVYPKITPSEVSSGRLVSLFRKFANPDHVRLAELAAGDVELDLSRSKETDVEAAFYRSQMIRLAKSCGTTGTEGPSVAAATFIEMQASYLINAADLHNASDEIVAAVVPSSLPNLTAASNILVLAAGCSRERHPRLAAVLATTNLVCGG
jgi:hypothetical protein